MTVPHVCNNVSKVLVLYNKTNDSFYLYSLLLRGCFFLVNVYLIIISMCFRDSDLK